MSCGTSVTPDIPLAKAGRPEPTSALSALAP
jgi:hypothetical protein